MEEDEQILKLISEEKINIEGVSVGTQFRLLRRIENLINKYKEQEKIIELMAEYIKETDFITESYCYRREDCENVGGNRMCKECILDYFRKKAKGE